LDVLRPVKLFRLYQPGLPVLPLPP
jgi:hypothetical protein